MNDKERIQKALSGIHASDELLEEVFSMVNSMNFHKSHFTRRAAILVAAAILALALATSAMAHFGLWDWLISTHRDADTQQRGEIAQGAVEDLTEQKVEMQETAEEMDSGIIYHFSVADWEDKAQRALVQVDDAGRITWLDLRELYPFAKPEDCPPEYLTTLSQLDFNTMEIIEGSEREHFLADNYLSEVAYPDFYAYNVLVQEPARTAVDFYQSKGYIKAGSTDIELVCFSRFSGGSAWVNVLMKNGDVLAVFLQPDDMTPQGFMLRTAAEIDGNGWRAQYDAEFASVANHALEEFRAAQQAEYAVNGVG